MAATQSIECRECLSMRARLETVTAELLADRRRLEARVAELDALVGRWKAAYWEAVEADAIEARLELAAWQGRPAGGLPGWEFDGSEWVLASNAHNYGDWEGQAVRLCVELELAPCFTVRAEAADYQSGLLDHGTAPTPRAAMRAAEVAAGLREPNKAGV